MNVDTVEGRREAFTELDALVRAHLREVCGAPGASLTPPEVPPALAAARADVRGDLSPRSSRRASARGMRRRTRCLPQTRVATRSRARKDHRRVMRFLHPEFGWWMVAALAVLGVLRWRAARRFVASTTVRWLAAPQYRASWFRRLPLVVLALAMLLLAGALMDPVLPYAQTEITSRGLDIVIALDLSSSMLEEMGRVRPPRSFQNLTYTARDSAAPMKTVTTRLAATKDAIRSFVTSRRDDRVALVVFSDNAYVISPLTFDHEYVVRYVDLIDDQLLRGEGMTAIGDGLALSNYLLAKQSSGGNHRNQVVILFTDGENNKGRDPLECSASRTRPTSACIWWASISRRKSATSRRCSGSSEASAGSVGAISTRARHAISISRHERSIRSRKARW